MQDVVRVQEADPRRGLQDVYNDMDGGQACTRAMRQDDPTDSQPASSTLSGCAHL